MHQLLVFIVRRVAEGATSLAIVWHLQQCWPYNCECRVLIIYRLLQQKKPRRGGICYELKIMCCDQNTFRLVQNTTSTSPTTAQKTVAFEVQTSFGKCLCLPGLCVTLLEYWTESMCCVWDICEPTATMCTLSSLGSGRKYRSHWNVCGCVPAQHPSCDGVCALAGLNKLVFVPSGAGDCCGMQYHSMSCSSQVAVCRYNLQHARRYSAIS